MTSSPSPNTESSYRRFNRAPDEDYEEDEPHFYPRDVPMTMIDRDGSILYETEDYRLLYKIVERDDAQFLEKYFTTVPWAVPRVFDLPNDDEGYYGICDLFECAIQNGNLATLQSLLDHSTRGLDTTKPIRFEKFGFQLLNEAARWGHVDMVQFLIDHRPLYAGIHDRDRKGYSAIAAAADIYTDRYCRGPDSDKVCIDNSQTIMNMLLDCGACASDTVHPMNSREKMPNTVLSLAAKWAGSELLNRLIDSGADVHIHTKVEQNSLYLFFWNHRDYNGSIEVTPIFIACVHANPQAVKTLIDRRGVGVDIADMICSPDSHGSLPIHWATRSHVTNQCQPIPRLISQDRARNTHSIIKMLLNLNPTTVNIQDNHGNTPLHYATEYFGRSTKSYTPIFELLCNRGADASIRNDKNETPLHGLFRPYGGTISVDPAAVTILLAHGAKPTDVDNAGNTPLHTAAGYLNFADAVSCLLEHGADPAQRNLVQDTALHRAALGVYQVINLDISVEEITQAQEDMLSRLVKAGGVELMNLSNAEGKTPRQLRHEQIDRWRKIEEERNRGYGRGGGRGRGRGGGRGGF